MPFQIILLFPAYPFAVLGHTKATDEGRSGKRSYQAEVTLLIDSDTYVGSEDKQWTLSQGALKPTSLLDVVVALNKSGEDGHS